MNKRPPCLQEFVAAGYRAENYERFFAGPEWGPTWSDPNWKKANMTEPLINPTKNTLRFKLGREQFEVGPEEEFTPPERYAYAITSMGLPLIPVSEFLAPTAHQKLKQEAAAARERAEALAVEAVVVATAADKADRQGKVNAKELAEKASTLADEHAEAVKEADRLTNAAAKPEAPEAPAETEAKTAEPVTVEPPKPTVKANPPQKPATKNGK
jgi:hypothetical protein